MPHPESGSFTQPAGPAINHPASLDRAALKGAAWMGSAKWIAQAVSWVSTIFIARILVPQDYGIVTMAGVYVGLLELAGDLGIGTTVVTIRELTKQQLSQFHALAAMLHLAGFGLSLLMAWPLGAFFKSPELPLVVIAMSAAFVLSGLQVVPISLLRRELRFRALAMIDVARGLIVPGATLLLALLGLRYWALVGAIALNALIGLLMVARVQWIPFEKPQWLSLGPTLRISREILASKLAWWVYSQADFAVAGRRLGGTALGAYSLAWNLGTGPIDKIMAFLNDVVPSIFSAAQHDRRALRRYFLNMSQLLTLATFPVGLGIAVVSKDFVLALLGPKWIEAAAPLAILASYATIRSVTGIYGPLFFVTGQTRFSMWAAFGTAIVLPAAFVVGSRWGAVGIATAWVVVHPCQTLITFARVRRVLDLTTTDYLQTLRFGADGALAMAACVLGLQRALPFESPAVRLLVEVAVGAGVFTGVTLALHARRIREIKEWFRRVRSQGVSGGQEGDHGLELA